MSMNWKPTMQWDREFNLILICSIITTLSRPKSHPGRLPTRCSTSQGQELASIQTSADFSAYHSISLVHITLTLRIKLCLKTWFSHTRPLIYIQCVSSVHPVPTVLSSQVSVSCMKVGLNTLSTPTLTPLRSTSLHIGDTSSCTGTECWR